MSGPVDSLSMGMISVHKVSAFSFCNKFPDQVPKELFVIAVNSSLIGTLITNIHNCGRRGGLMVGALDSGVSGPGSSPGRGHCVVFLGKTLYSHSASLHPGV